MYQPPRFMTIKTAIEQLLEVEAELGEGAYDRDTLCVGLARVGSDQQSIVAGTMGELQSVDFGPPLHSFVIAGPMHHVEEEMLNQFRLPASVAA